MPDYFSRFCCVLDVRTIENALDAADIHRKPEGPSHAFPWSDRFVLTSDPDQAGILYIEDGGSGDVEGVVEFVLMCARRFDLTGFWGFQYANMCSHSRIDGFGGGAYLLNLTTRETVSWIGTHEWLEDLHTGGAAHA